MNLIVLSKEVVVDRVNNGYFFPFVSSMLMVLSTAIWGRVCVFHFELAKITLHSAQPNTAVDQCCIFEPFLLFSFSEGLASKVPLQRDEFMGRERSFFLCEGYH